MKCSLLRLAALFAIVATCRQADANIYTWTGGGGNVSWNNAGNWSGGIPVSGETTDLVFGGNINLGTLAVPLNQNISGSLLIDSMTFSAGGGPFFLGGGAIQFNGGNMDAIVQNSSSAVSITNNVNSPTKPTDIITLTGNGTGLVTLSGIIAEGVGHRDYAIDKTGTSTFFLSGNNTYSLGTTIDGGTLMIDKEASLGQTSGGLTINAGTLEVVTGFSTGRNIVLGDAASGITVDPSQTYTITTAVTGTGGLTKGGTGTLSLSGANLDTFTGTTTVNAGTLILAKTAGSAGNNYGGAIRGDIVINSGATVQLGNHSQIDDTKNIWVNGGTLNLLTWTDGTGTGGIQFTGGSMIASSTGVFRLGGTLTTNASSTTATISGGQLWLNLASGADFNIASGSTPSGIDLLISNTVANGLFGTSMIKDGAGTMELSGANTYTGSTTVNAGVLNIQNSTALGTGASGTTVNTGAALQMQGGIAVTSEALTLNGGGISNDGALRNISGNNSWGGTITLASVSTIASDSGTLTLSGGLTNGGFGLTDTGAGNIVQSGAITGGGGLTKTGAGTVTLSGANTYTGATAVNAGTLFVNGSTVAASTFTVTNVGSTLGGNGTIGGSVNVGLGANLSPGSASGGTGILTTGSVNLASGSNFVLDLNNTTPGSGYDQLKVNGTVNVTGSNLVINPGAGLTVGEKFFIVVNDASDAITGQFNGGSFVIGGNDVFQVNYIDNFDGGATANDISLTFIGLVPEPSTWGSVAVVVGIIIVNHCLRTRKRKTAR